MDQLIERGFSDVQCTGFGRGSGYHGVNETASVDAFQKGYKILQHIMELVENGEAKQAEDMPL